MRTPKEEREIIAGGYVFSETGERNQRMTVYASDYGYMAKFDRFVAENPEEWHVERVDHHGEDITGKLYSCPTSCISFRRGRNKLSEETRKALAASGAARMAKIHEESLTEGKQA